MKLSFNEMINSEAFAMHGEKWAKACIALAFITALIFAIFAEVSLGWKWILAFPILLFGPSLLIAMPAMLIFIWLNVFYSKHANYPFAQPKDGLGHLLFWVKNIWSLVPLVVTPWVTWKFLQIMGSW